MTTTCETPGKHRANMVTRRAGAEPAQVARRLRDVVSRAEQRQPGLQQPPFRRRVDEGKMAFDHPPDGPYPVVK